MCVCVCALGYVPRIRRLGARAIIIVLSQAGCPVGSRGVLGVPDRSGGLAPKAAKSLLCSDSTSRSDASILDSSDGKLPRGVLPGLHGALSVLLDPVSGPRNTEHAMHLNTFLRESSLIR